MNSLRILWRLLFYRPLILVLLLLVYAVAALLLVTVDSSKSGIVVTVMTAFSAAGLSAILTERIARFSLQAGTLGLPDHARMMRQVQGWYVAIFVVAPVVPACLLGVEPLAAVATLLVSAAAGILLVAYGAVWILLVPLLGRVIPLSKWAAEPFIQALAAAGSAYLIWRWFDMPSAKERAGGAAHARLSDARHERRRLPVRTPEPAQHVGSAGGATGEAVDAPVSFSPDAHGALRAALAVGLGYSVTAPWRRALYGFGIAATALAIWWALHGVKAEPVAYSCVTALCCLSIVGALQRVLQRWMRTVVEQALLCLTPRWPESRRIKRAVIASTLVVQRGTIAVWASSSAVAALFGWIDWNALLASMLAVLGTSLAFTAATWAVLAQRRVREWHLSTIISVLMVGTGAMTVLLSGPNVGYRFVTGMVLMAAPLALALAWYLSAPLRLPLNVDPRALKAGA